jgi:hypothetical protein
MSSARRAAGIQPADKRHSSLDKDWDCVSAKSGALQSRCIWNALAVLIGHQLTQFATG